MKDAKQRQAWINTELAAMRVPDLRLLEPESSRSPTLVSAVERWMASRVDVDHATAATYGVSFGRVVPLMKERLVDEITAADIADLVASLHRAGLKRESIRKTKSHLAMVFDYAGVSPNPARAASVKLPREDRPEVTPPNAADVLAVCRRVPTRYRLPLLVLDATGMRVGEVEALTWADVRERDGRWRVSQVVAKTRHARWVEPPEAIFEAVTRQVPRDDRDRAAAVFTDFTASRLRTAINRACRAVGVSSFSPHDLRHRHISMLHAQGVSWARIGEQVGQRNLAVTANTYTHVLIDETQIDYVPLLDELDTGIGAPVGARGDCARHS